MNAFINYALIFIYKLLDISLSTAKSKFLQMNKNFLSSLVTAGSQVVFLLIIKSVANDTGYITIITIVISTFIGSYFTTFFIDKAAGDNMWKFTITPFTKEDSKMIIEFLQEKNIAFRATPVYNNNLTDLVLGIDAFAMNKYESKIIKDFVEMKSKYHIMETK